MSRQASLLLTRFEFSDSGTGRLVPGAERAVPQQAMMDGPEQMPRPTRKRFNTSPCTVKNRCAWATDLNQRIWRSRWRVG